MKRLVILILMIGLLGISQNVGASDRLRVLTSIDVVQVLAEVLTKGTHIDVENVIPEGYSVEGHGAYIKKHHEAFAKQVVGAECVIGIPSVWADDPLYPSARQVNIRIVNMDATCPLDGVGAAVPFASSHASAPIPVWNGPANLMRMAVIMAADLSRLSPDDAVLIESHLAQFQSSIFALRTLYEAAFAEKPFVEFAALTTAYDALADDFGINILFHVDKPENRLTEQELQSLTDRLAQLEVKGVICPWQPTAATSKAITDSGAVPVVLQPFSRRSGVDCVENFVIWYKTNLSGLLAALNN